jgi:3-oxoacyl-[acyl-carrier-protein] synthase-1
MTAAWVTAATAACAAGRGRRAILESLIADRSGLTRNHFGRDPLPTWIGAVPDAALPPLPAEFAAYECRNNRLAWLALAQDGFLASVRTARERHGPERVALVLGTSTSSIGATEEAYRELTVEQEIPEHLRGRAVYNLHSTGDFLGRALELEGIAVTIATACSSGAKAFAHGARLLDAGIADAVVVGGVDSLCGSVLFGFNSLGLVSPEPCQPFDVARCGINLGEAAALALLERQGTGIRFLGAGESSDAHHMSAPHPDGLGARIAMTQALANARIGADDVDYINLHGTASAKNDAVEAKAIADMFRADIHASSTKGWTGHALGAAGALEALITMLSIEHGFMPGTLNSNTLDPACGPQVRLPGAHGRVRVALSNSFGFGGSNCTLVFAGDV